MCAWRRGENGERRTVNTKLTLGLSELLLLNTRLNSLVELSIKGTLGRDVELVVRLNILLDSLTTTKANPLVTSSERDMRDNSAATYLLPLRSLSYTATKTSQSRRNTQISHRWWWWCPKGKDVSRSGATRITTSRAGVINSR